MNRKKILTIVSSTAVATVLLSAANVAQAFNMGNMMNPGEWFDDDDDDYYRHGRYYGRGYGPYGGYGGPYGPYGYGGYGTAVTAPMVVTRDTDSRAPSSSIREVTPRPRHHHGCLNKA